MKRLNLFLLVAMLLVTVVMPAGAAPRDPFPGVWTATDLDGSHMRMQISAIGAGYSFSYYDDATGECDDLPAFASGTGTLQADGSLSGILTGQCDPSTAGTWGPHPNVLIYSHGKLINPMWPGVPDVIWLRHPR